jgi:hypothetical protein
VTKQVDQSGANGCYRRSRPAVEAHFSVGPAIVLPWTPGAGFWFHGTRLGRPREFRPKKSRPQPILGEGLGTVIPWNRGRGRSLREGILRPGKTRNNGANFIGENCRRNKCHLGSGVPRDGSREAISSRARRRQSRLPHDLRPERDLFSASKYRLAFSRFPSPIRSAALRIPPWNWYRYSDRVHGSGTSVPWNSVGLRSNSPSGMKFGGARTSGFTRPVPRCRYPLISGA